MHCDVKIRLCKPSLWFVNTHSHGWLICTAYLAMHTATKLQYTIFTRTHFPTTEFQTEKYFQALISTSGIDKQLCSQEPNMEEEGLNLSPILGRKKSKELTMGPLSPQSLKHQTKSLPCMYICNYRSHLQEKTET